MVRESRFFAGLGLVAVLMTVDTTELAVISRVEMAIRTLAPFALVIT